ncbi:PqiA/YebS family transporter subunit [Rheinheimera sp. MMS21-TC3]|uniref:PqiA/YebS family transporter subunit n=1 Tax=Rheinheimera sp. MMS21-TC3 TaxID=3072790 RepID=UPI0028C39FF3|nr:PqiA/YebS family transporter subunit [Rheinheimera sp. MMS21-TC3]WNO61936.1 PqiA/YebS family transporter subunit [Rheinheimera sp. MMS21-TC3]
MSQSTVTVLATTSAVTEHATDNYNDTEQTVLCRHCDLVQTIPALIAGQEACCSRCNNTLDARHQQPILRPVLYAATALFMLLLANLFPFVSMYAAGDRHQMSFFDTSSVLFQQHHQWLALLIWLLIQAIPAFCMSAIIYLKLAMVYKLPFSVWVARVLYMLKPWSMVDIFLMGLIISFVKLVADAEISLGPSFWAFCIFCLLHLRVFQVIDRRELWSKIAPTPAIELSTKVGQGGLEQGLKLCQVCTAMVPVQHKYCSRCHSRVYSRQPNSIQNTLALLVAAIILYIPANLLPIMITESFGDRLESTIISGLIIMWQEGAYPVAIIILIASVIVPVIKIIVLLWLCYLTRLSKAHRQRYSTQVYRVVDWIGRWSMVDVLVVAIMAALVRFDLVMSVYPGVGVIVFAAVVIITMLAALSFDPRLLWDARLVNKGKQSDG